jgi:hypothetical protein
MAKFISIALAGFTKQPTYSFLDKIVFVVKQYIGNGIGIGSLAVTDKLHGAYHSYTLLPDGLAAAGQII